MNQYSVMLLLIMSLVAISVLTRIFSIVKMAGVEKKRLLYERLLKEARGTRMIYIKRLETSDNFRIKLEGLQVELKSEKFRLNTVRCSIREIIEDVRSRLVPSKIDKLEAKVILQKKITLGEHWKVLDNFRLKYNKKLASFRLIENESRIHLHKTTESCDKWEAQKSVLMSLYDELKGVSKVVDPRSMLVAADN